MPPTDNTNPKQLSAGGQPVVRTREQWFKHLKLLCANGLEEQARGLDKYHNIGYFETLEKLAAPKHERMLEAEFLTVHPAMLKLKADILKLIDEPDPVLLIGESGTGKELLARALHGIKQDERFVELNCAGMPEYLLESELFGHVKGAFTGADKEKPGLFNLANEGTLFLDEIGELPLQLQPKLLRALQFQKIRKVGGLKYEQVNCRIVCATHRELPKLINQGKFRLDLYHRINTFELFTLPLKERLQDIPLIVDKLDPDKKFPRNFNWQELAIQGKLSGNVRTVQAIVRRFLVLGQLPDLKAKSLSS